MDVLVERGCGLDVHQKTVVACWLSGRAGEPPRKVVKTFSTMTRDLLALRDGLRAEGRAHASSASNYIGLNSDQPAEVEIHPAYQRRKFTLGGAVAVSETIFVPLNEQMRDDPVAYLVVEMHNMDSAPHELRVMCFARLRGSGDDDIEARYEPSLRALVAHNKSEPNAIRIFGLDVEPTRYETTFDYGSVYDRSHVHPLSNDTTACGDILGALQLDSHLRPNQSMKFCVITGVYAKGERAAIKMHGNVTDCDRSLAETIRCLEDMAHRARVFSPDPIINQGALWAKVNMRRVMGAYPQGYAFTNEPGVSSNIVMRDAAWFVYGCDHFYPDLSRALVDKFSALQYPDGKIPEYYNAIDGHVEDYGLNINDDTPQH